MIIYFFLATKMSEENKLVKMVTDSAVLDGLTAGVGYMAKKILNEHFLGDPSSNVMNYAKFTGVLAGSMAMKTLWKIRKYFQNLFKMASIAIMLGGAVLNASTFIGGSYLAKYLSGTKTDQERRRHDKALEKYQKDYTKYQENRQKLLDWQEQNRHEDAIASRNFENTDEALKLYNKFHPDDNMQINEPVFSDYYRPSKEQKIGEMACVSGGMMVLGYAASKWL